MEVYFKNTFRSIYFFMHSPDEYNILQDPNLYCSWVITRVYPARRIERRFDYCTMYTKSTEKRLRALYFTHILLFLTDSICQVFAILWVVLQEHNLGGSPESSKPQRNSHHLHWKMEK